MESDGFISLIGAIGLGGVLAALITRGVEVAKHRQAWINALRDDISDILARGRSAPGSEAKNEHGRLMHAAYVRVQLRLNMREDDHKLLDGVLREFVTGLDERDGLDQRTSRVILVSRSVLKREWEVTKWGFLAKHDTSERESSAVAATLNAVAVRSATPSPPTTPPV